ncbi:hypothetical protein [Actinoplanes sp. ATCC 53533]|uniref:hypothetical protein n=1 Tax=Actinoplanes sp. ATCC 53533 TaxID=1288362 RepID=UPI000F76FFF6|nr:hypothetical protein [Actinoplanes sp. ATCC 53533]
MGEHDLSAERGASMNLDPTLQRLLDALQGSIGIAQRERVAGELQVRPTDDGGIALYFHPSRVEIVVDRHRLQGILRDVPGAVPPPVNNNDPYPFVKIAANVVEGSFDAVLSWAIEAVKLRSAGRRGVIKDSRSTSADAKPQTKCPRCNQYVLLANGECPGCDN